MFEPVNMLHVPSHVVCGCSHVVPRLYKLPVDVVGSRLTKMLLSRFVVINTAACRHLMPHLLTPASGLWWWWWWWIVYCYKILFGFIDVLASNFAEKVPLSITRGHNFKLYKNYSTSTVRAKFFSELIVSVWNNLPVSVDFSIQQWASFTRTIKTVDLSKYLRYS